MDEAGRRPGIRPRPTLGRRLDATARACFPATCTAILMLATQTPFGFADQAALMPAVTLACVYFWSLFRPASMSPPVVAIGVFHDLLGYVPVGAGVLSLLAVHGIAVRGRRVLVRQGFVIVWLALLALAAAASALSWALESLLLFRLLPPWPAMFQCALTGALYPALAILFTRAHRSLADPARA